MMEEFVAQVFGMPKADPVSPEERRELDAIMGNLAFPSIRKTPQLVQVPATPEQMHDTGNSIIYGQAIPTAVDLVNTIAYAQGVPQETAIRWLAHRADTFKTLSEYPK
jgi:hypothetical protein